MSFEAESNSELTVIVPAYQLHFRFPVQNKQFCRTTRLAANGRALTHDKSSLAYGQVSYKINF
jgi:hypothetical protein